MKISKQYEPTNTNTFFSKETVNAIIFQVYAIYSLLFGSFIILEIIIGAIKDITFFSIVGSIFIISGLLLLLFSRKTWKLFVLLPSFLVYIISSFFVIILLPYDPDIIDILLVMSVIIPTLLGFTYLITHSLLKA